MAPTSPSPSPLLKNPFSAHPSCPPPTRRHGLVSLRTRAGIRTGVSVLILFVLVYIFNELRCLQHGCTSRIGVYGGDGAVSHVGGGAVIGKVGEDEADGEESEEEEGEEEPKEKIGESVWGTHGVVGGWFFRPKNGTGAASSVDSDDAEELAISSLEKAYFTTEEEYDDEYEEGDGLLMPPPMMDHEEEGQWDDMEEEEEDNEAKFRALAAKLAEEKAKYYSDAHLSPSTHVPGQAGLPDPDASGTSSVSSSLSLSSSEPSSLASKVAPIGAAMSPTASPVPSLVGNVESLNGNGPPVSESGKDGDEGVEDGTGQLGGMFGAMDTLIDGFRRRRN